MTTGNSGKTTLSLGQPATPRNVDPRLQVGDPAPWFRCASNVNPDFDFSTAAGRYVVLAFFGSTANPVGRALIDSFLAEVDFFADPDFYFFGLSVDPADRGQAALATARPGMDMLWDEGRKVAARYQFCAAETSLASLQPMTILLDPGLRVLGIFATNDGPIQAESVMQVLRRLPRPGHPRPAQAQAPVLVLPNIFERDLCRRLIDGYQSGGSRESGFMVERDGKTVEVLDPRHKRRKDWIIGERELIAACQERIRRRLVPEIRKAFAFEASRMERHIVACYDQGGGYFRPHRDNTTKGTAHRRFAVTINLNAEDYTGGDLTFPEFGRATYRAPTGGAIVFSCSLLHEALPVLRGQRFAYLPFLYDEAAAEIRQVNNAHLGDGVSVYQMAPAPRPALASQDHARNRGKGGGKDPAGKHGGGKNLGNRPVGKGGGRPVAGKRGR